MALKTLDLKVADYMSPKPITVTDKSLFSESVQIMAEKGIGNLIVIKNHQPLGILTERQILEHVSTYGKIKKVKVSDIKLSPFYAIDLATRVIDAARLMVTKKSRLIVLDEKRLVGIITATDMVRAFRRTSANPDLSKVASTTIYTVKHDDSVLKAAKLMYKKRIGSVIVMKNDLPYGIFTERDLLVNVLAYDVDMTHHVGGYCSFPLITNPASIRAGDASKLMSKNKIKRLVLTKNKKMYAVVTARDIVDAYQSSFPSVD